MVKKSELPHHIVTATLQLAAETGWNDVSLADIAARAELSLSELYDVFRSKDAVLAAFQSDIDRQVLSGAPPEEDASPRDRLFDVLMRRFDALEPHKAGVEAILRDLGRDPVSLLCGAPRLLCSMAWMLEAAGIRASGVAGLVRAKGLALVYLPSLRVWLTDDSPDMARTMAALDKSLRRAESLMSMCGQRRRREPETADQPA